MKNIILHIDMDAFFAAIEQRDNPELQWKPVIVGRSESNKGIVTTASYEARKYGVHSAMPIFRARKLCPDGIFVRGHYNKYSEASDQMIEICKSFTPYIKKVSIDEAYLDISGSIPYYKSKKEIAEKLKGEIKKQLNLTCSIGIAPNKMLAKIASDMDKPDGLTIIDENNLIEILNDLPISKIPGIGNKTEEKLQKLGIYTVKDLGTTNKEILINQFGKFGKNLYFMGQGMEVSKNRENFPEKQQKSKSIGNEITLKENTDDKDYLESLLLKLANKVCYRLRKKNASARTVTLKIKFDDFIDNTHDHTLSQSVCYESKILKVVKKLLGNIDLTERKVRLIGIRLSKLEFDNDPLQLNLFSKKQKKITNISKAIDKLRDKYGKAIINVGRKED